MCTIYFIYFFQNSIIKQSCKNSVYDNGYFSVKLTPTLNRESVSEGFPTASELLEEKLTRISNVDFCMLLFRVGKHLLDAEPAMLFMASSAHAASAAATERTRLVLAQRAYARDPLILIQAALQQYQMLLLSSYIGWLVGNTSRIYDGVVLSATTTDTHRCRHCCQRAAVTSLNTLPVCDVTSTCTVTAMTRGFPWSRNWDMLRKISNGLDNAYMTHITGSDWQSRKYHLIGMAFVTHCTVVFVVLWSYATLITFVRMHDIT